MIKLYFLLLAMLFGGVWLGLDWYMDIKKLSWHSIGEVWPLWTLLLIVGFLLGGVVWGVIAQLAIDQADEIQKAKCEQEKEATKAQCETEKKVFLNELESDRKGNERTKKMLAHQKIRDEQALAEKEAQKKAKRKVLMRQIEAREAAIGQKESYAQMRVSSVEAENKKLKQAALTARIMLDRIQRKQNKQEESL